MSEFWIHKKIYYHDTDCGGVVYYANYLKFMEEARTEYLAHKGIDIKELVQKGAFFVVAHVSIDYKAPARYQDRVKVFASIEKVKAASIEFFQKIVKGEATVAEARVRLVFVGRDLKPRPIGQQMRTVLSSRL